jgi:predicted DCC family thiol-disulfide oxidoreductase YuxK
MEDRLERGDWLVLYDADCGFCQWLLAGLLGCDRACRLRPLALQRPEAEALLADLTPSERMASWHLLSPAGERRSAGAALPALLRLLPGGGAPAALFAQFPGASERGYRWVAEHRELLSKPVPASAKRRARRRVGRREELLE